MNMDVQSMFLDCKFFSPDAVEQGLTSDDASTLFEEQLKDLEFFGRQLGRTSLNQYFMSVKIHVQLVRAKFPHRTGRKFLSTEHRFKDRQPFPIAMIAQDHIESGGEFLDCLLFAAWLAPAVGMR